MDENAGCRVGNKSRANTDLSWVTSSAGTAFVVSFEEENMDCLGESDQPAIA